MKRIIISLLILVLLPAFAVAQEKKYEKTDSQGTGVSFKEFSEDIWYLAVASRDEKDASKVTIRPIIAGRTVDAIQIPPENIDKVRRVSVLRSGMVELVEIKLTGKLIVDLTTLLMSLPPVPTEEQAIYRDEKAMAAAQRHSLASVYQSAREEGPYTPFCTKCRLFHRICCDSRGNCKGEYCPDLYEEYRQRR